MSEKLEIETILERLPQPLLEKIDIEETIKFNQLLLNLGVNSETIYPLTFELMAYVITCDREVKNVVESISGDSLQGYELTLDNLYPLFDDYKILQSERYYYFIKKILLDKILVYSFKKSGEEYLFLEKGSVTGSIRILKYPDKIVLMTLSGYD